jgi:type VI secretion system secreted protein VgrG
MYLDQQGRVCIQFFWDKVRAANVIDNTWVRVAQPWAGIGWGTYFWPRVNDEVVVQFLDGDPDKPVVSGSVYNGVNMAKYPLPDMSTRTGILTRSSKGGTAANANELRFEDKAGSEQIFINAEHDMDLRVEHDRRDYTMGQHSFIVDKDHLEQFNGDHHYHTKGAVKEQLDSTFDQTITGAVTQKFSAALGQEVTGDVSQKFDAKLGLEVSGAVALKYDDDYSQAITGKHQVTNQSYAMASKSTTYITGASVVIEAQEALTIMVGGNFVNLSPAGVAINGTMVLINSGGAAGSGSPPSPDSPSAPTAPQAPKDPDKADDGTKGTKM